MSTGHFQEFEDEYLETMYEFYEKDPSLRVRTGSLAESLKISPASATEMVQRLASKGFLDYNPYKGSSLTAKGLEHGKMMKRRHRLAEVLLEHLPFDGNQHETACRLEHAIDDDLDVALSVYLGKYVLLFFFSENLEKNFFYWSIRILIIFPLYQILLIIVGTIFGEFKYFWEMEKKILRRFGLLKS